jgi:hypothetical protein
MHRFLKFVFGIRLYMFRTVRRSIIRNFLVYTQQWNMSYSLADSLRAGSGSCVQWKTPDDGQRNCPKHADFYSKNKFEKLVHPVGFIRFFFRRCTVTWTSNLILVLRPKQETYCNFFLVAQEPYWGLGRLNTEVLGRRYRPLGRTPLDEESVHRRNLYVPTRNIRKRQKSMPSAGFEPTIPAS